MPTENDHDFLHAVGVELAVDAMKTSDKEALEGVDPTTLDALRARMLKAADEPAKRKLRDARNAYEKKRAVEAKRPTSTISRDEKQRRIERFFAKNNDAQLTLHFRDGTGSSDKDIDTLFDQLVSLGMDPDDVG